MPDEPLETDPLPTSLPEAAGLRTRAKVWRSEDLLGESAEAIIEHAGQQYRLRRTRQGKLILFK